MVHNSLTVRRIIVTSTALSACHQRVTANCAPTRNYIPSPSAPPTWSDDKVLCWTHMNVRVWLSRFKSHSPAPDACHSFLCLRARRHFMCVCVCVGEWECECECVMSSRGQPPTANKPAFSPAFSVNYEITQRQLRKKLSQVALPTQHISQSIGQTKRDPMFFFPFCHNFMSKSTSI